jgi:hypothetical protein
MASCRADPLSRRRSLPTTEEAFSSVVTAPVSEDSDVESSLLEDADDEATSSISDLASCKVDLEAPVAPGPEGLDEDSKAAAEVSSEDESCAAAAPPPRFFLEYSGDDKADLRCFFCRIPSARFHALAPVLISAGRPGDEPERHDDEEKHDTDGAALLLRRETTGCTATHANDIPAESYENLISNSSKS